MEKYKSSQPVLPNTRLTAFHAWSEGANPRANGKPFAWFHVQDFNFLEVK